MATIVSGRGGRPSVYICDTCGVIVPPDRDECPNDEGGGVVGAIMESAARHPLRRWVPEDVADAESGQARQEAERARLRREIALSSLEAAQATIDAAKAALSL